MAGVAVLLAMLGACSKPATVEEFVPEMALTGLDGTQTSLGAFRGKLLVLNVWASWCLPCRSEMPSLERLSKSVDANRMVVVAIASEHDKNAVREFTLKQGITLRCFIDTPVNIFNTLGVQMYPETLLIAPDGKIVQRIKGERDWSSPAILKVLEDAYQGIRSEPDYRQAMP